MNLFTSFVLGVLLGWLLIISQNENTVPKDFPAYCIDPFASEDMGGIQYGHCANVPMWSLKV